MPLNNIVLINLGQINNIILLPFFLYSLFLLYLVQSEELSVFIFSYLSLHYFRLLILFPTVSKQVNPRWQNATMKLLDSTQGANSHLPHRGTNMGSMMYAKAHTLRKVVTMTTNHFPTAIWINMGSMMGPTKYQITKNRAAIRTHEIFQV